MSFNLSKLEKVNLREIWKHEAHDFTNWLALDENLGLLSEAIGIDISLIQTEASVGKFNVDILAVDNHSGRKIVIENQLETTDHDHLGKIITYASGLDANTIIWIVKDVREEHKQAIDWLNEHTNEEISFFAINIELWKIGGSNVAPNFNIISQPNNWAKTIKSSGGSNNLLTDTKLKQQEFWQGLKDYSYEKNENIKFQKAHPQHWSSLSIGTSLANISLTLNTRENIMGIEIYINHNKELYHHLFNSKELIENSIGEKLIWKELPDMKASRIKLESDFDFDNNGNYSQYYDWLIKNIKTFSNTFSKYIKYFK